MNNEQGAITELKSVFEFTYEFARSVKNFLDSETFNISEKEKNSDTSLVDMLAQIVNNNFGAAYLTYDSKGKYIIRQMFKQNFNHIQLNSTLFKRIFNNSETKLYDAATAKSDIEELMQGITEDNMKNIPKEKKKAINAFVYSKTGIRFSYLSFDNMISDMQISQSKIITPILFKNLLNDFATKLSTDRDVIKEKIRNKEITKDSKGDETVSDFIKNSISDVFFKSLSNAHLINYVMKSVMNIETLTGEKLPTFKLATLTQKDAELFDLQRNFERESIAKGEKRVFRSHLIKDEPAILGTGTRLELTNGDINKSASKFSVSESFTANFQFEFLQSLINDKTNKNNNFSVQIGNYSDKSTIIVKTINGNFKINGTAVIELSTADLLEEVRKQGANYYKDTYRKVEKDLLFLLNLETSKDYNQNITKINNALKGTDIRSLSKKASDNGINLTEELHYSKYNGVLSLNQYLLDSYKIFNNPTIFAEFVERQEQSMLKKFRKYNKSAGGGDKIAFTGTMDIKSALKKLNLTDKDFDKVKTEDGTKVDYTKLEGSKGLNPMLKK